MDKYIHYKTIVSCKLGSEEAMQAIIKHYEPIIAEASKVIRKHPDGTSEAHLHEDIKAYIESELAMKILLKYDPTIIPRKKRPQTTEKSHSQDPIG